MRSNVGVAVAVHAVLSDDGQRGLSPTGVIGKNIGKKVSFIVRIDRVVEEQAVRVIAEVVLSAASLVQFFVLLAMQSYSGRNLGLLTRIPLGSQGRAAFVPLPRNLFAWLLRRLFRAIFFNLLLRHSNFFIVS